MSKARELAELSRTVADSADAVAITVDSNENTTFTGVVTANAGVVVDNITIDGTTLALSSGDLTLDVAGDIILDADGADFKFRDGGAGFFTISNSSLDAVLKVEQSDEDFIIKGNDGGSEITALTLDMSAAGIATFNSGINIGNRGSASDPTLQSSIDPNTGVFWGGSDILGFASGGAERLRVSSEVVVNDPGNDVDFRVESDSSANMLVVDGAENKVGINRVPNISNSKLEVGGADNVPIFNVEASGVTGGMGIGASGLQLFHGASSKLAIASDGVSTFAAAVISPSFVSTAGGTFTTASGNDLNIVYPDGRSLFFKEAGTTTLTLDNAQGATFAGAIAGTSATFTTADNLPQLQLISTDADNNIGPVLNLWRNSASPANGDEIGRVYFYGENDASQKIEYVLQRSTIVDVTDGAEDSQFQIYTYVSGAQSDRLRINQTETVFNESSRNVDFRVESDTNANAIFMDASTSYVGINRTPSVELDVQRISTSYPLRISAADGSARTMVFADSGSSPSRVNWLAGAQYNTDNGWELTPSTANGGYTFTNRVLTAYANGNLTVNENGIAADFRVESDTNANAMFVDGSENTVVFGNTAVNLASGFADQTGMGVHANDGYVQIASDSTPLTLGRTTTAGRGAHIIMRNASAAVAEIGDYNGVPYIGYTGGAGGGIMFNGASVEPTAIGNARTNGANDIGSSNYRWRNGMFSNTVQAKSFERLWNFLDLQSLDMGYFYPVSLDGGSASVTQSFELFKYYGNYNASLNGVVQHGACTLKLDISAYSWGGNIINNYLHHVGSTYRCMIGAVTLRGYYIPVIWLRGGYGYHWTSNNPSITATIITSNTSFYSAPYNYTIGRITDSVMQGKTGYLGTAGKLGIAVENANCNNWYT